MDFLTLSLMLLAGLLHASWHGLVKSGFDQTVTLAGMGIVAAAAALAVLPFVSTPPSIVWPVLAASVALHGGYKICLAQVYFQNDLAQAFPLARGAVPLFATFIAFVALGQTPTPGQIAGVGLVSVGVLWLALENLKASFNPHLLIAASGTGFTVAAYSVIDAYGTRLYGDWLGFTAWLVFADSATFLAFSRFSKGPKLWRDLYRMKGRILASGCLGVISFGVFLWALSRGAVGPVSAVRETSVLFAILIGVLIYKEPLTVRRVVSGTLIVTGVFAIATWR